ncbi:hypothetical protein NDU88_000195 [Pleurodeles waltl]|uniref:Uncharacterized protein n=1 Tax=Pleurodeles waltl TaxID=8319 RepID=A0AAV7S695_PLEWA|nr:hypothetical protein NDU88_000195 [Pleurodeles waltl]
MYADVDGIIDGISVDDLEVFVVVDFFTNVDRLDVAEWNIFVDGPMLDDSINAFSPWGIVDGKAGLYFMVTDVIVIDNGNDVIMGRGSAVNVTIAVVVVVIKAVVDDAVVNETEIFYDDGGRHLDVFFILIVLAAGVKGSE